MPPVDKNKINLLQQEENVKKKLLELDKERAGYEITAKEYITTRKKLNKMLDENVTKQKEFNKEAKKSQANLRSLRKDVDDYANSLKKGSDLATSSNKTPNLSESK